MNVKSGNWKLSARILCAAIGIGLTASAHSQEEEQMSLAKAAQKSNNPVSDAWLLIGESDTTLIGTPDGHKWQETISAQPVMPVPIFDGDWNLVNRVVTGFTSSPGGEDLPGDVGFNGGTTFDQRTTGNTDTIVFSLAAPNRDDGFIWGVGPTFVLPTATQNVLGDDKWQAGPAALVANLGSEFGGLGWNNWNTGILAQHWWDFAGNDDRESTNHSNIQYFLNWRKDAITLIGMTPNILIDWNESGNDRFTVPVGLGTIGMFKWGKMPVRWGLELQYYVMQPNEVSPEWNLKFFIAPVAPNPFKS